MAAHDPQRTAAAADRLSREFPDVAPATVREILTDSQRVVLGTLGVHDVDKAAELARLRIEVRTRTRALSGTGGSDTGS